MNHMRSFVYNFFKSLRRFIRASPLGAHAMLTIGSSLLDHYVRHAVSALLLGWGRPALCVFSSPSYRPNDAIFTAILEVPAATSSCQTIESTIVISYYEGLAVRDASRRERKQASQSDTTYFNSPRLRPGGECRK